MDQARARAQCDDSSVDAIFRIHSAHSFETDNELRHDVILTETYVALCLKALLDQFTTKMAEFLDLHPSTNVPMRMDVYEKDSLCLQTFSFR